MSFKETISQRMHALTKKTKTTVSQMMNKEKGDTTMSDTTKRDYTSLSKAAQTELPTTTISTVVDEAAEEPVIDEGVADADAAINYDEKIEELSNQTEEESIEATNTEEIQEEQEETVPSIEEENDNIKKIATLRDVATEEKNEETKPVENPSQSPEKSDEAQEPQSEREMLLARLEQLQQEEKQQAEEAEQRAKLVELASLLEIPAIANQVIENYTSINSLEDWISNFESQFPEVIKRLTDELAQVKTDLKELSNEKAKTAAVAPPSPIFDVTKFLQKLHKLQELTANILDAANSGDVNKSISAIRKEANAMNEILDGLVKGAK